MLWLISVPFLCTMHVVPWVSTVSTTYYPKWQKKSFRYYDFSSFPFSFYVLLWRVSDPKLYCLLSFISFLFRSLSSYYPDQFKVKSFCVSLCVKITSFIQYIDKRYLYKRYVCKQYVYKKSKEKQRKPEAMQPTVFVCLGLFWT